MTTSHQSDTLKVLAVAAIVTIMGAVMLLTTQVRSHLLGSLFGGGGLNAGIQQAAGIGGIPNTGVPALIGHAIFVMQSFVLILGILAITVAGMYLLLGFGDESSKDKAKKIIIYTIVGIAITSLAGIIVEFAMAFFAGHSAHDAAVKNIIQQIIDLLTGFATLFGVLAIVIAGFTLIFSLGDDSGKEKAKKTIIYTIAGLLIINFVKLIVAFAQSLSSGGGGADAIKNAMITLLNGVLDLVTTFALVTIVIAGFYLILSNGDDASKDKAKKTILYTVAGLIVILLSRVIVVFVTTHLG